MATTVFRKGSGIPDADGPTRALREAGVNVVEVDDWNQAAEELRKCQGALLVCNADDAELKRIREAIAGSGAAAPGTAALPRDLARALSHELRTPLSAMVGWIHLLESGKLDEEGCKRAIAKLRNNIEEQVRTIERYLGATTKEGPRQ